MVFFFFFVWKMMDGQLNKMGPKLTSFCEDPIFEKEINKGREKE